MELFDEKKNEDDNVPLNSNMKIKIRMISGYENKI
jgi:hypothetical protein